MGLYLRARFVDTSVELDDELVAETLLARVEEVLKPSDQANHFLIYNSAHD